MGGVLTGRDAIMPLITRNLQYFFTSFWTFRGGRETICGVMKEETWFYSKDGGASSGVPESEVAFLLESRELGPHTLLWKDGMEEWKRADHLPRFASSLRSKPEEGVEELGPVAEKVKSEAEEPLQPHPSFQVKVQATSVQPWTRYFARSLDLSLAQTVYFAFGGQSAILFEVSVMAKFAVPFLASWVLAETVLLTYWGTTPGKWLLGIEISTERGERLHWKQALRRSVEVWIRGMALGIPLLTPLAQIHAYSLLTQQGVTPWDRITQTVVRHKQVPIFRWFVVLLLLYGVYSNLNLLLSESF